MLTQSLPQSSLAAWIAERFAARNAVMRDYFAREAPRVTSAAEAMAERFARGGRLFAFGRGPYATDAAHLSVEFVHPVIVGKRALPALDVSAAPEAMLAALATGDDVAVAFGPPAGDASALAALSAVRARGVLTLALPGEDADYAFASPALDAHVHQELFELVGHTLYESVHVFLEHEARDTGADGGAASFLYPFLGPGSGVDSSAVARSVIAKASDGEGLRTRFAERHAQALGTAIIAIARRLRAGARILALGNGGSATDATDFALDCVAPDGALRPLPALSLAVEPAVLTALGNDVGMELTFVRQVIAQGRPGDVLVAFSTSGGSKNVVAALAEARTRGLLSLAILGHDGGEITRRGLADHTLVVEADDVPRIQETQAAIYHILRSGLDRVYDDA